MRTAIWTFWWATSGSDSKNSSPWRKSNGETKREISKMPFLKSAARVFARYRELMAATAPLAANAGGGIEKPPFAARDEMVRLNAVRSRSYEQEESLKPGVQTHGHVWLYLNAASKSEPVATK